MAKRPLIRRVGLAWLMATLVVVSQAGVSAAAGATLTCRQVSIPVDVGVPGPTQISGTLCQYEASRPSVMQVLLPGGTYARYYWNFPYRPEVYSYVARVTSSRRATLAIDRLGTGQSSRPPSAMVTVATSISAVHQVIQAVRQGAYGLPAVPRVVTVGHSAGSAVALWEAGIYQDVDGVLVTGFLHGPPPGGAAVIQALYPAALDPRFLGLTDPGYLTTWPGQRSVFYSTASADPAVIAVDETLKSTDSATLLGTGLAEIVAAPNDTPAWLITVPVLLAIGELDAAFCPQARCTAAGVLAHEIPFYANAGRLDVTVIPQAGHDLNLHPGAPAFFDRAADWVDSLRTR